MPIQSTTRPIIELHDVKKVYSSAAGEFTAVNGISATIHWEMTVQVAWDQK